MRPLNPCIFAPPPVRAAFESFSSCGVPLVHTRLGAPLPGAGSAWDCVRVAWTEEGDRTRAAAFGEGEATVGLDSYYVLPCRDRPEAVTLAVIMNSDIASAWLQLLAKPAREDHQYNGSTMAWLPLPRDWTYACSSLPRIAEGAISGGIGSRAVLDAVLRAYGVRLADVAPLLAWAGRSSRARSGGLSLP